MNEEKQTLLTISNDFKQLRDMLESETDKEIIMDTLEALQGDFEYKIEGCACVYDQLKAQAEMAQKKANAWDEISKALENNVIRLNNYMKLCMENAGLKEVTTNMHRIKITKNGGKLPLSIDEGCVPEEYLKTEAKQVPDKDKIRKALESGECLTFARLEDRGTRLKID